MDEEKKHLWYQPGQPEQEYQEELDLFEEAGLYELKDNDELLREYVRRRQDPPKKKRRWAPIAAVTAGVVLLLTLIIGTAVFFSQPGEDPSAQLPESGDWSDYPENFDWVTEQTITGENTIPRAELDPEVQLLLAGTGDREPLSRNPVRPCMKYS